MRGCGNLVFGSSFLLKPAFCWLFSVAGASFVVLKLSLKALTFLLDLASEPSNPRLFVPAP